MSRKVTRSDVENALLQLSKHTTRKLAIEFESRKCRVIEPNEKGTYSVPFGHTWHTYKDLFFMIWFAIDAMRIAGVERSE